jgi:type IV secretory pathway VirB2 component (pilin)
MNFFSKQISTIFLSLSFFLISSEGWAGTEVNISGCNPLDGVLAGVCLTACPTTATTYDFTANSKVYDSYLTTSANDPLCKSACLNACLNYRESSGEFSRASTSSNTFSRSICNALRIVTGSAGKTFAAFAIIATGIGFFSGKVSWGLMIGVAAGIATMFGAPSIVAAISGTTVDTKCGLAAGAYTP